MTALAGLSWNRGMSDYKPGFGDLHQMRQVSCLINFNKMIHVFINIKQTTK